MVRNPAGICDTSVSSYRDQYGCQYFHGKDVYRRHCGGVDAGKALRGGGRGAGDARIRKGNRESMECKKDDAVGKRAFMGRGACVPGGALCLQAGADTDLRLHGGDGDGAAEESGGRTGEGNLHAGRYAGCAAG